MVASVLALVLALAAPAEAAPEGLEPPRLVAEIAIDYPAELAARDDPPRGEVVVRLVVGTDGVPHSLTIVRALDPSLDALALAAVARLRYLPARYQGQLVEVEIDLPIAFAPPTAPAPTREPTEVVEPAPEVAASAIADTTAEIDARLRGRIREAGSRVPLVGVTVTIVPAGPDAPLGLVRRQDWRDEPTPAWQVQRRSDLDGRFAAADARPGRVRVIATSPGHERTETVIALAADEIVDVELWMVPRDDNPYRTVVKSDAAAREEVTRRTITRAEIGNLPGTQGDALKSIQNFPGMARAPFGIGLLVIRGADPTDSAVFLGEHEIPQLFHFGGLTSVFNADMISNIDFLPGNFDARYGDATGGVIDVKTRAGRRDGVHGYVDADLFDAGGLVEGPVGKGSFAVAARRSYVDALLPVVIPSDAGIGLTLAPRYYDYQGIFTHPLGRGTLTARVFGSDDRTKLVAADANDVSQDARDRFETTLLFHRADLVYENHSGGWDILITPSYRYDLAKIGAGELFRFTLGAHQFSGRAEIGRRISRRVRIDVGTQTTAGVLELDAESIPVPQANTGSSGTRLRLDSKTTFAQPALYGTVSIAAAEWLTILPSARLHYYAGSFQRATVDPRLRFVVRAGENTIRGGVGIYSQIPDLPQFNARFGNPRLGPEHALHTSLAFRRELGKGWSVELGGFYKYSWALAAPSTHVVRRPDGTIGPETFASTGFGRIGGGELFIRKELTRRLFGWVSYTLSRSQRRFDPKQGFVLFDFDQTHVLTVIAVYKLPRRWQIGARFRVVSGNPYTPTVGSVYDAAVGDYVALAGRTNSARVGTFHQLDLRVDKRFVWRRVALETYADVQNVYNHQNPEFLQDSFDFTKRRPVNSLPILPSLGLRLSW